MTITAEAPLPPLRRLLFLVLLLGAGIRAIDLWRPVDGHIRESWREADVSAVARNFSREGMNILYPRIDWRGDGPGYLEMEFPLYPWSIAVCHRLLGYHEVTGRIISYLLSLATLAVFLALAVETLPGWAPLAAGLFWALNPLEIRLANAIQPEPLMFFGYVAAVYAFRRWLLGGERSWFLLGVAATALALLAKLPALHLGILFAALLFRRHGLAALRRPSVWAFATLAIVPALLWYRHAHQFWLLYGNSFGISNEYHWIGWDFFTDSSFATGILRREIEAIWMPTGAAVALFALPRERRSEGVILALWWLFAVGVFYLVAARTTGDRWATYYHIVSLPGAALLVGAGAEAIRSHATRPAILGYAGLALVMVTALFEVRQIRRDLHPAGYVARYDTAMRFAPLVPRGDLILASGGVCEEQGHEVAYNASYFFYWMDRKGFNICREQQSLTAVAGLAARGARYFVAERPALAAKPGFESELRRSYPLLAETGSALLFDLRSAGRGGTPPPWGPASGGASPAADRHHSLDRPGA